MPLDHGQQLEQRAPEPLPDSSALVLAEPGGADAVPVPPDATLSATGRDVVRAAKAGATSEKLISGVPVDQDVVRIGLKPQRRHPDTIGDPPPDALEARSRGRVVMAQNQAHQKVRQGRYVGAAFGARIE